MSNTHPLTHLTIINSRPSHQAEDLTSRIQQLGGSIIELPCLIIQPEKKITLQEKVTQLKKPNHLIFVSANAVHSLIPHYQPSANTHIIAIGPGTAQALMMHDITANTLPHHYNSSGILELPELQSIQNQHIIISCGYDSRPHLQQKLQQRGATVQCIESYHRIPATPPTKTIQERIQQTPLHAIIVTSQASLEQLSKQFHSLDSSWIKQQQLLVITTEQERQAHTLGFIKPPWIAKQADTNTIVNCLLQHTPSGH